MEQSGSYHSLYVDDAVLFARLEELEGMGRHFDYEFVRMLKVNASKCKVLIFIKMWTFIQ